MTCAMSLPGLKLQIYGGKKLLQLLLSGSSDPLIELSIHWRCRLQNVLRRLQKFLSLLFPEMKQNSRHDHQQPVQTG